MSAYCTIEMVPAQFACAKVSLFICGKDHEVLSGLESWKIEDGWIARQVLAYAEAILDELENDDDGETRLHYKKGLPLFGDSLLSEAREVKFTLQPSEWERLWSVARILDAPTENLMRLALRSWSSAETDRLKRNERRGGQ